MRRHARDLVATTPASIVDAAGRVARAPRRPAPLHRRPAARARGRGARSRSTSSTRTPRSGRVRGRAAAALRADRVTVRAADLHRPAAAVDRVKLRYRSTRLPAAWPSAWRRARPRLTLELPSLQRASLPVRLRASCKETGRGLGRHRRRREAHAA